MASAEQRDEQAGDDGVLADDDFADFDVGAGDRAAWASSPAPVRCVVIGAPVMASVIGTP